MSSSILHPSSKSNPSSIAMKTQFLSLCLFLFFICAISAEEEAVLDIAGNELQVGSKYYIVSAIWGAGGGGLSLSSYRNEECPITVTQERSDRNYGIPASFHPADSNDGTIHLSKSVNVIFDPNFHSIPSCANSTVWQVGRLDPYIRSQLITIEGVEGKPGCATLDSWFKIEKGVLPGSYKFASNPGGVCSDAIDESYDLRVGSAFGERPLVQSNGGNPFNVVFIKYDDNVLRTKAGYIAQ